MLLWAAPQEALGLLVEGWQEHRIIYLWAEYMGVTAREQMQKEAEKCGQHFCLAGSGSAPPFSVLSGKADPGPFTALWITLFKLSYPIHGEFTGSLYNFL